jgi:hypothetical protein
MYPQQDHDGFIGNLEMVELAILEHLAQSNPYQG